MFASTLRWKTRSDRYAELVQLVLLLGERLDDVDADDVLLGDGRDVGHLLLDVAQHRVGDARVAVREDDDQGRDRGRDERELPVDEEHDHRRADDRQHVLEEEDEAVAEEEADGLQVDGRAGEQLARLVPVVEAEREPEQLRVERVPHVVLDAERLAARDQAAPGHEQCPGGADEDDCDGDSIELAMAVRRDRVLEAATGQVGDHDRGGLGADREDDRDDQGNAVRPEETEQAEERLAIRGRRCHGRKSSLRYLRRGRRGGETGS